MTDQKWWRMTIIFVVAYNHTIVVGLLSSLCVPAHIRPKSLDA
jgi:hypothetical protein